MRIKFVEIQNYRKLKSIRIDFSKETTILVGANNSGKTSAMVALKTFLIDHNRAAFNANDFTLSNWKTINKIGETLENISKGEKLESPSLDDWVDVLPTLDIWFDVPMNEIHRVSHILPTLDWNGGNIGVRLRYEPKAVEDFNSDFIEAYRTAKETLEVAKKSKKSSDLAIKLWPESIYEFLVISPGNVTERLKRHFTIKAYPLDPNRIADANKDGTANPQTLPEEILAFEGNPLDNLIRISEISAHRGFVDARSSTDEEGEGNSRGRNQLSNKMRSYYRKHLDPMDMPDPDDLAALKAISDAQKSFDERLQEGFSKAINELANLGYPGIANPAISIATKIRPLDGLNHSSAVQYSIGGNAQLPKLPEVYNGLGYQNLISMVFDLMQFRDEWLQEGKARKKGYRGEKGKKPIQPVHLVMIEEPEAHLHVQVQQVFIREAYKVLVNHEDLKGPGFLSTQLLISTHSSHIAHEVKFGQMRYFRRLPVKGRRLIPCSGVINLAEVFGSEQETDDFVTRYLRSVHCELFFADAIIMVEGAAERILLPHFLNDFNFEELRTRYISVLEIGGNHAHRLKSLIEHIGVSTLIITDIDAVGKDRKSKRPMLGKNLTTQNPTLIKWLPEKKSIDELINLDEKQRSKHYPENDFSVHVAYQQKYVSAPDKKLKMELYPSTFEDAYILDNINEFQALGEKADASTKEEDKLYGHIKQVCEIVRSSNDPEDLADKIFDRINMQNFKAQFAIDVLYQFKQEQMNIPAYIYNGLEWLQREMKRLQSTQEMTPIPVKK